MLLFTKRILKRSVVDWEQFKEFYESESFQPYLPPQSNWRHWRVKSADGVFRKVRMTIRTKADIKKMALRYAATDIYYSVAQWVSPLSKKGAYLDGSKGASYAWADNLLLNPVDLVFDLDAATTLDERGIEEARLDAVLIAENTPNVEYVCWTGGKGFHVNAEGPEAVKSPNPSRRISDWQTSRKIFIEKHLSQLRKVRAMTSVDKSTSTDLYRIRRLPGSVHGTTGIITRRLTLDELKNTSAKELLNHSPHIRVSPAKRQANDELPRLKLKRYLG